MQLPLSASRTIFEQCLLQFGEGEADLGLLSVGDALGVPAGVATDLPLGLLGAPGLEVDALLSSAFAEALQRQCAAASNRSADDCSVAHACALQCT